MADAKTKIADIIEPSVFEGYAIERTAELTSFYNSGIVGREVEFDSLAAGPSRVVDMPFWVDLPNNASNRRQILSDSANIETRKITSSQDKAQIHTDANAWSSNVLAKYLAGSDPMGAIVQLVGEWWAREDEQMLISTIKGVLGSLDGESGDPNYLKIASEDSALITESTRLTGSTFIDALQKAGDRKERLTAIAMHSATEASLRKRDLIDFVPDSEGKSMIKVFQGLVVIVDDTLAPRDGTTTGTNTVYTSVLFGQGAIGRGFASLSTPIEGGFGTEGVELARVALASDTQLINRRRHLLHPRGVKWNPDGGGSLAGVSPTNTELETAAKWTRVYEAKNVRLIGILHNI